MMHLPITGIVGSGLPWDPSYLSPKLWVDDTVITSSGSNITNWTNKGSLGGAFQASSLWPQTGQTLNSLPVVDFAASGDRLIGSSPILPILNNMDSSWFFFLYILDTEDNDEPLLTITENVGSATRMTYLGATGSIGTARIRCGARRVDGGVFGSTVSPTIRLAQWVMALSVLDYQARTIKSYVDGSLDVQSTNQFEAAGNTPANNSANAWMGAYANGTNYIDGKMAEVLGHSANDGSAAIPIATIDRIFGYAAHKWGLTANLPGGHPYKVSPPTT